LLSIPESTNRGWHARLNGTELTPVVVDGWQQGWVIPAGLGGTVVLTFDLDGPYRWSLLIGLALVGLLFLAAAWRVGPRGPGRAQSGSPGIGDAARRDDEVVAEPASRRSMTAQIVAGIAGFGTAWLLGGWWGVAVAAIASGLTAGLVRRARVIMVFGAMALATVLLAVGPWHSGLPYTGHDAGPQFAALCALAFLIAGTMVPLPGRAPDDGVAPAPGYGPDSG
ncbi:MAG: DUF3367 domain-containing protein, partial [Gordonia sp. (in: high G+C Gram-positive bacteria)]